MRFGTPATMSLLLHVSVLSAVVLINRGGGRTLPPIYRVELVAAPAGPRAVGVVTETPAPAETPPTPPKRAEAPPPKNTVPVKAKAPTRAERRPPAKATPTPDARSARRDEPAPKAGGGPEGGKGADVANVSTPGIEFPYPAYLTNIVRQIALRFDPGRAHNLSADVVFLIRRDGSVVDIRLRKRSGSFAFDTEATGAVEAAARAGAFGPLPDGFGDDVLTVIFSFDPRIIR
jgi:outer membrane biosynthesis protein TonB